MKTSSLLVYFPGYPFRLDCLFPDAQLASIAGALLAAGHTTQVLDYGTIGMLGRQYPDEVRESVVKLIEKLEPSSSTRSPLWPVSVLWGAQKTDRAFRVRQRCVCSEIAGELARRSTVRWVLFKIATSDDCHAAQLIAKQLRASRADLKLFAFGAYTARASQNSRQWLDAFDGVIVGSWEETAATLAERLDQPTSWPGIPNFISRENATLRDRDRVEASPNDLPPPVYATEIYPALNDSQKFHLFSIDEGPHFGCGCHACPQDASRPRHMMKSAERVYEEIKYIVSTNGSRAFDFSSPATSPLHMNAVAQQLLTLDYDVVYSRTCHIPPTDRIVLQKLAVSGCAAVAYHLDSGSQRLLDTFYGRRFTVSEIERVLHASRDLGMYTAARFVYPCPQDDYHTQAETLRLIDRTGPHAVAIELPELRNGSAWSRDRERFGFRRNNGSPITTAWTRFPLADLGGPFPEYRLGWRSPAEVWRQHREMCVEIEKRGVLSPLSVKCGLIARLCGAMQDESSFFRKIRRMLYLGDTQWFAGVAAEFNRRASQPVEKAARWYRGDQRAAAGN